MKSKLAIFGGRPTVPSATIVSWPYVTEEDERALLLALHCREFNYPPPTVSKLETAWAKYLNIDYAIAVSSGTAALQLALMAIGVEAGDSVIVPAISWPSSATAVLQANCVPVFADIDPETFCINPESLHQVIVPETKVVITVNLNGLPANYDALREVCKQHSLLIIEDSSQSQGAEYRGQKSGDLGDISATSINGSKNLSAFDEGGLIATNKIEWVDRIQLLRSFAEFMTLEHQVVQCQPMGWSYRMGGLAAAFANSQLLRLDEINAKRISNCDYLSSRLDVIPGITIPHVPKGCKHVYFYYTVRARPEELGIDVSLRSFRDVLANFLVAEGVPIRLWQHIPIPLLPLFQSRNAYGHNCPWNCSKLRDNPLLYSLESYPMAQLAMDSMLPIGHKVGGLGPPNDHKLMSLYADAFEKVLVDNIAELAIAAKRLDKDRSI